MNEDSSILTTSLKYMLKCFHCTYTKTEKKNLNITDEQVMGRAFRKHSETHSKSIPTSRHKEKQGRHIVRDVSVTNVHITF